MAGGQSTEILKESAANVKRSVARVVGHYGTGPFASHKIMYFSRACFATLIGFSLSGALS